MQKAQSEKNEMGQEVKPTGENLRVSVVIPCHNEQRHIGECLESLLNQNLDHTDYELIVVDDGSTDRTVSIVRKFEKESGGRLRFFQQHHAGPALARNFGAKHARGKILAFLDSDMKFEASFVEKLIGPIESGSTIGTFTLDEFVANPTNLWSRSWSVCYYLPLDRRVPENPKNAEGSIFRAIRKADFTKVGGFDSTGYHDDHTVAQKLNQMPMQVPGAVCYHYNPDSFKEVFASARWIGKSDKQPATFKEWLRRTPPGSLKRGIARAVQEKEPFYVIFDQVYSFGVLLGMLSRQVFKKDHSR